LLLGKEQEEVTFIVAEEHSVKRLLEFAWLFNCFQIANFLHSGGGELS